VPAFLSAAPEEAASAAPLAVEPGAPFSWRARTPDAHTTAGVKPPGVTSDAEASATAEGPPAQKPLPPLPPLPSLPPLPAGYELPAAKPSDGGEALADSGAPLELTPMGYPALELPARAAPPLRPTPPPAPPAPPQASAVSASTLQTPLPPVDFSPQGASQELGTEALALVEDRSPAAVLQASRKSPASAKARSTAADEDERDAADADPEVSFVRAARRQAFWRKPQVRVALVALILVALAGLALQIAIQERDRLAATDARLRPMLAALCTSLQCDIAPQRQIADIVIDSSSFNKARGDSYHLALTMKNKASIPLAMPAVELTLTDAQDQPVLRRVLLPADMGAPAELPAGGEWNASVSVIVTTGGARVAGYRLLAFYP
jgi:hypothetical protein